MAGKRCYQFIVKDKVQDVGLRLAIARLIPDELDVRADNLPDGSVRVIVRGEKREVVKFWKQLRGQILGKAENPAFSGPSGMNGISVQTDRFFHKLQCEQMETAVEVWADMKNSIDAMSNRIGGMDSKPGGMSGKLDGINGTLDSANTKLDGVSLKLDGMNSTLRSMEAELDTLPRNMAEEMVRLKGKGFL